MPFQIGLNLSFELRSGRNVALLIVLVLDYFLPVGTCKEHEVELVIVFIVVVRLRVLETGSAVFHTAFCRLDTGVAPADRVREVGLKAGLLALVQVALLRLVLTFEATLEEVLLCEKIATLSIDWIAELLLFAARAGVSEEFFATRGW